MQNEGASTWPNWFYTKFETISILAHVCMNQVLTMSAVMDRPWAVSMGSVNPFSFEGWSESQTESKVLDGMRER